VSANGHGRWGWHQLCTPWAERFVADAGIRPGDLVIDVGAGSGALTDPLVRAGARVIAVEAHPARAAELRRRFAGDPVVVVQADAADLRLPRRPFRVVANPPFSITTPLLRRLTDPGSRLVDARLVVQRQAGRDWAAGTTRGARRSAGTFRFRLGAPLPRRAFDPAPHVSCVELVVTRRSTPA
jgi:23S rRNA (adenine-N6)-dimethyltransferase